jgi:hypothetical protein
MPIKQSTLEKKWYYRIAKVFFLVLPLIYIAIIFLNNRAVILSVRQDNISEMLQRNIYKIVFTVMGVIAYYLLLKLIWKILLYILFGGMENDTNVKSGNAAQAGNINAAFSPKGLKFNEAGPLAILVIIFIIIFLAQLGYIKFPKINADFIKQDHSYGASCTAGGKTGVYGTDKRCYTCSSGAISTRKLNKNCSSGAAGTYCCFSGSDDADNGCVKTGCDHLWYCSGSYYIGGQEIIVPGLCYPTEARNIYPSWSGTCRKCP